MVNVVDAQSDPRFEHAVDIVRGTTTRSVLCAPILSETTPQKVLGVVEVINKQQTDDSAEWGTECCSFDDDDANLLTMYCAHIGEAVASCQHHAQNQESLSAALSHLERLDKELQEARESEQAMKREADHHKLLVETAQILSVQHEFEDVFNAVATKAIELLGCERGSLFLVDDETRELWSIVAKGEGEEIRLPIGQGFAGQCAASASAINIDDAYRHPGFDPSFDAHFGFRTTSVLCVPLFATVLVTVLHQLGKSLACFS